MIATPGVAEVFEHQLFLPETDVYDPEGVHHGFSQGLHGRKVDIDQVKEGSELYEMMIWANAGFIHASYPQELLGRAVFIGVANGSNRIARDTAAALDCGIVAVETRKVSSNSVELTEEAVETLQSVNPLLAVVTEDVGTRGTNSSSAVVSTHLHRPPALQEIEVSHIVERGLPERLVELGIRWRSLITRRMKDYSAEECAKVAYCKDKWQFIPHGQ